MPPASARLDRAWDIALASLTVGNWAWSLYQLGGYRPETQAVTAPLLLLTVSLVWARAVFARECGGWQPPLLWWPVPFLVYAALQVTFLTPVPWLGWQDWFLWLHLAAAYWLGLDLLARPLARRIIWGGVLLAGLGAVALAVYQRTIDPTWLPMGRTQAPQYISRSGGPFGIPNSLAALMLLLLPPAAAEALRTGAKLSWRVGAGVVAALFLAGLLATISRGAWLCLVAALAVVALGASGRTWAWRLGRLALVVGAAALLSLVLYRIVPTVRERVDHFVADRGERTRPIMWHMSWKLFREAPLLGTGGGSYRVLLERHRPENFRDAPRWAHHDYLNTLSDYGLVGFTLSFGVAGTVLVLLRRRHRAGAVHAGWRADGMGVALVAFGLSLTLDFHLKVPALTFVLGLYLAEWVRRYRGDVIATRPTDGRWRVAAGTAAALLVGIAVAWERPQLWAEGQRYSARQELDGLAGVADTRQIETVVEKTLPRLRAAVARDPANGQAWSDLALALSLRGHYTPDQMAELGREAEAAAERALMISRSVAEFWLHRGIALNLQGRWSEAGADFTQAVALAPHDQLVWYYQAYHYSLRPMTLPLARAAVATCLRLDPGNPAAEALRDRLRPN